MEKRAKSTDLILVRSLLFYSTSEYLYRNGAKQEPLTLNGVEFLRRFCLHTLPHRFVKIRRYGIYSSKARASYAILNSPSINSTLL
jgi:hypothetical protein